MPSLELLPARDEFPRAIFDRFSVASEGERTAIPMASVGGAVRIAGFPQPDGTWIVATAGLSRLPIVDGEATELWTRVDAEAAGAAEIALRTAVEEIVDRGLHMWGPGHVWMNDAPLLKDTRIQALAINPTDDPAGVVRAGDGTELGRLRELWLLTKAEARSLALDGSAALDEALARDPLALAHVERTDVVTSNSIPDVPCLVSKLMQDAPARWVETDREGRFLAFTQTEPAGYLDDAKNMELWSLPLLVDRNPEIADFVIHADPMEYASYQDGHWVTGRLADLG